MLRTAGIIGESVALASSHWAGEENTFESSNAAQRGAAGDDGTTAVAMT